MARTSMTARDPRIAFLVLLFSSLPGDGHATIRRVPSSFPTIAWGLSVAVPGDTVLVAPGVYTGDLYIPNGVTLLSESGPAVTRIVGTPPVAGVTINDG